MQREYLFRGKRRDNGEWAYGLIQYTSAGDYGRICGWMGDDGGETYQEVEIIPETIGQFTGAYDKKDEKIYEGDICLFAKEEIGVERYREIVFEEGCFVAIQKIGGKRTLSSAFIRDGDPHIYEVVGNIHDNPELIKP